MLVDAPPKKPRPRAGKPRPAAAAPPPPPPPPPPLEVTGFEIDHFDGVTGRMRFILNTTVGEPLLDVTGASGGKWTARYEDVSYVGVSLENETYESFFVNFSATGADPGTWHISYANAPSDIADAIGRQLAAFSEPL